MHKNLHADIIRNIEESQKNGGVELKKLAPGTRIEAQTKNSLYKITVREDDQFEIQGGFYFPMELTSHISGSTWGGSMLKMKWLGVDMHIELWHPERGKITTTAVRTLKVIAPDESWEYSLGV